MNKTKSKAKDSILQILNSDKIISLNDDKIAEKLQLDVFDTAFILEELNHDELVDLRSISSKTIYRKAYMASISNKGKYFIKYDSFLNQFRDYQRDKIWKIVKIVAAVLNALAIILIGIWNLYLLIIKD